ncbi:MAG TPA: LamG-like jellyroll fold domain-containing protein [Gemmatimonadaceae bacterium]|nr:LamG-like jellyroll fold domain-containing protein [Gemmatimonadaceae bacterium]
MVNYEMRGIVLAAVIGACSNGSSVTSATPQPPPAVPQVLLHTTLDNPGAISAPAVGTGTGAVIATAPSNDFVVARIGSGLRTDAIGERVQFPQTSGGVQNVELLRGTLEFWYRPNYNHDDNLKYAIAGTGDWQGSPPARGSIHLGKHNSSNQNKIFLIFYDANQVRWEHNVAVSDYSWRAGDWLQIRLTWDFGVAAGVQNLHLYVNGQELRLTGEVSRGPQPVPAESTSELVYIGSRDTAGTIIANGLYDDVKIWNAAIPPN